MENAALCICDLALLARCDPLSWDLENIFERLIPRREVSLKRVLTHASVLQDFGRAHTDDAGTLVVRQRLARQTGYDIALGAKDTAYISIVVRPMYDLSAHVALSLKRFLEEYPSRFANVNFDALRMAPLMTVLLRSHVREYLGDHFLDAQDDEANNNSDFDSSSDASTQMYKGNKRNVIRAASKTSVSEGFAPSSDANSITSSLARAVGGATIEAIRFGPPVELLSASPLSVHLVPYGRNAFFPELLERRRHLEMAMHVDPDAWRAIVYPPKLVAAVLRFFVSMLHVPARVVLPRLAEVLPGAVKMHYQLTGERELDKTDMSGNSNRRLLVIAGPNGQCPTKNELGIGMRYFPTMNTAVKTVCHRAHFLSADVLLILHFTPHAVFGTKYESPLVIEARVQALAAGVTVVEKVDVNAQQDLLQALGMLARKFSHVFVVFEDVNAFGGSISPECRLVLTRLASNKFTLLCDGTYNVANPCAASRAHWLNSARNTPGGGCSDAYVIGTGAFLPTVTGRGAIVVYPATRVVLDVGACLEDPQLPLLIDDAVVVYTELVKSMGLETLTQETNRAAQGICDEAKAKLFLSGSNKNDTAVVNNGIIVVPLANLGKIRSMTRSARRSQNAQISLEAPVARSLETVGVSCCITPVNLVRVNPQIPPGAPPNSPIPSTASVLAAETEESAFLCAIMTPHLQTVESVPWDTVWKILAGFPVAHPDKVPTLASDLDTAEGRRLHETRQRESQDAAKRKKEKEDAELLDLIKLVVGGGEGNSNLTNNNNISASQVQGGISRGGGGGGGAIDDDLIARDPYSYTSRLDNLLAVYEPLRAGSAHAMMEGMLEDAKDDFYGFKYDDSFSAAVVGTPTPAQAKAAMSAQRRLHQQQQQRGRGGGMYGYYANDDDDDDHFLDDDETDPNAVASPSSSRSGSIVSHSSFMRRDVLEAIHLGRCVLRYGREPADNAPLLIASILKQYCQEEQFEKLPVLLEAYKEKEGELLDSLVQKFVPPHRRAQYRPRTMLLRAPPCPDNDVALARRLIHKCLHAHRPKRIAETSSIAHLLAPLVTLVRQRQTTNPLSGSSTSFQSSRSASSIKIGGVDFLEEEDTDGSLVKRILEEEVGIVPRAVGVNVVVGVTATTPPRPRSPGVSASSPSQGSGSGSGSGGGGGVRRQQSPVLRGGSSTSPVLAASAATSTPAMAAFVRHNSPASLLGGSGGGGGDGSPNSNRDSANFLNKLFNEGDRSRGGSVAVTTNNNLSHRDNSPHRSMSASLLFGIDDEHRSASLALEAAQRADGGFTKDGTLVPSIRDRVTRFYARYDPSRIPHIDELLHHWLGREELLMQSLCAKYGPEPAYNAPIRTHARIAHQTRPEVERPGALVNVMRDYYTATVGPAGRAAIDEALEVTYPPEQTHERVVRRVMQNQPSNLMKDQDWNGI